MTLDTAKIVQLAAYWSDGSDRDFATASDIINQTIRYASGLFFLHLSVEKAIKSLIVKQTSDHAPFSHNLLHLAAKAGLKPSADQELLLAEVNEFNLEARYPDERLTLEKLATKAFSQRYLVAVQELLKWISAP